MVIPTFNRASLLAASLDSLARQSLAPDRFEVIVIDDGSTDGTARVCQDFHGCIVLRHYRIDHAGTSAAKNLGLFLSVAPLVFFFDDDDLAGSDLLAEHLEAHRRYPQTNLAILGHTSWAPALPQSELMRFVTGAGAFLFSYGSLSDGQVLDFTYFWAGRSSCKRAFLAQHGVFRPLFNPGLEDIELGSRLARFGLQVVYWARARQFANRAFTFEAFCRRCERHGMSQYHWARLNPGNAQIAAYCQSAGAEARWKEWECLLPPRMVRVHALEEAEARGELSAAMRAELYRLYEWSFLAHKTKGMVEAMRDAARCMPAHDFNRTT
ncbi:MAG TPA: glycosyltransferase family A protein [Thermoanaerobaculia bacterium]|nr:glycosyltransferase family A protein [Thermoanaerobaculia bacterium]